MNGYMRWMWVVLFLIAAALSFSPNGNNANTPAPEEPPAPPVYRPSPSDRPETLVQGSHDAEAATFQQAENGLLNATGSLMPLLGTDVGINAIGVLRPATSRTNARKPRRPSWVRPGNNRRFTVPIEIWYLMGNVVPAGDTMAGR